MFPTIHIFVSDLQRCSQESLDSHPLLENTAPGVCNTSSKTKLEDDDDDGGVDGENHGVRYFMQKMKRVELADLAMI